MKTLSLKLDDTIFQEAEKVLSNLKIPRNRYINEAIEYYNKIQRRKYLEEKLAKESKLCRENSMEVLRKFEAIDFENEAI